MKKETIIYQYTGKPIDHTSCCKIGGVWYIDVPNAGRWYCVFNTPIIKSVNYAWGYSPNVGYVLSDVSVTVREYLSGGQREKVTIEVSENLQGRAPNTLLKETEMTDVQPSSGTPMEALVDRCELAGTPELRYLSTDVSYTDRLVLIINGVDFSMAAQRLEYTVTYEDRVGAASVMMLNGDQYPDVLAQRPVITCPLNMMWADELSALYTALGNGNDYVSVQYFDTWNGKIKTAQFKGTVSEATLGMDNDRGIAFRSGSVLTLRAR